MLPMCCLLSSEASPVTSAAVTPLLMSGDVSLGDDE